MGITGSQVLPISLDVPVDRKKLGVMEMWLFQMKKEKGIEEMCAKGCCISRGLEMTAIWALALCLVGSEPCSSRDFQSKG